MNRFCLKIPTLILIVVIWIATDSKALLGVQTKLSDQPIIILAIDKMESVELLESQCSAIRELLEASACGVMSVRTGSGYSNTESAFLTLGSGNRSIALPFKGGAFSPEEMLFSKKAGSFWNWSTGAQFENGNLIVPEISGLYNQAEGEGFSYQPGLLGEIFRTNGWKTYLYGDQDSFFESSRPGGYTLMDQKGIVDSGLVGIAVNEVDHSFPERYRFNSKQIINEIRQQLKSRSLIMVEFGDFARLDRFRNELLTKQYLRLKEETWERLDKFIGELDRLGAVKQYRLIIVSPSLSREGVAKRSMLAPIIIKGEGYPKGLLTSGTTSWKGLVANIDILPTLLDMAGLKPRGTITGRAIYSIPNGNHLAKLMKLNAKVNQMNSIQRSLLDWYLWTISTGWLAVTLSILLKKRLGKGSFLITIAVLPLAMLIMPLTPFVLWQEGGLFLLVIILTFLMLKIKTVNQRYLVLSGGLWGGLILDQFTGWNLIRFSALGYSAVAGSRYYGMGNEFMGIFLAVSLVFAHLLIQTTRCKWLNLVIICLSLITLGWPQLGINFGGTLAALVGFTFYLIKLYGVSWKNRKFWSAFGGIILAITLIGWWDSLRDLNQQTHLGRFFKLLFEMNLSETWQILSRKAAMNYRLIIYSAWTKTVLLAGAIAIFNRLIAKKMVDNSERILWNALLISGFTAFLINDSGVVAFGTCLAYGFTFFLSRFEEREFSYHIL